MKFLISTIMATLSVLILAGCSTLFYFPDKDELVYRHKLPIQPKDVYFLSTDGTKLHGWYFGPLNKKEPRAVIVQFHGNAQNLTTHFLSLYEAPARDLAYFIFDYRGYGRSDGRPEPAGMVKDGIAAIKEMHKMHPNKPLIVFAQSLGGAIAFRSVNQVKNEVPISMMLAECTFPDYRMAAQGVAAQSFITYLFQPLAWAIVDNSESPINDIPEISPIPLVVVHGTKDRVINESLGRKVFELAKEPKEFWSIPEGQHLQFMFLNQGEYGEKFFDKVDELVLNFKPPKR